MKYKHQRPPYFKFSYYGLKYYATLTYLTDESESYHIVVVSNLNFLDLWPIPGDAFYLDCERKITIADNSTTSGKINKKLSSWLTPKVIRRARIVSLNNNLASIQENYLNIKRRYEDFAVRLDQELENE